MPTFRRLVTALLAVACATAAPLSSQPRAGAVVVFETGKGNIEIEVDARIAR